MNTFKDKYFAIPGDMPNATSFWGALASPGYSIACWSATSTDTKTCDGNGDGYIDTDWRNSAGGQDKLGWHEAWHFWVQLADSGIIEGKYNGNGTGGIIPGQNSPSSKVKSNTFFITAIDSNWNGWGAYFISNYGNVFVYNSTNGFAAGTSPRAIDVQEAYSIDTKFDDGKPGYGNIMGPAAVSGNPCTADANNWYLGYFTGERVCPLYIKSGL